MSTRKTVQSATIYRGILLKSRYFWLLNNMSDSRTEIKLPISSWSKIFNWKWKVLVSKTSFWFYFYSSASYNDWVHSWIWFVLVPNTWESCVHSYQMIAGTREELLVLCAQNGPDYSRLYQELEFSKFLVLGTFNTPKNYRSLKRSFIYVNLSIVTKLKLKNCLKYSWLLYI